VSPAPSTPSSRSGPAAQPAAPRAGSGSVRGRPTGAFTQHRRFDALRNLLYQHPKGLTIYELADKLRVTPRSLRRYLAELRRELDLEPTGAADGRAQRWRIAPAEVPRRVSVRRSQAYALLAARTLFSPLRGSTLFEEIDLAAQRLLGIARRPGRGPNAGVVDDARLEDRFLYVPFAPKDYGAHTEALDDLYQAVADLRPLSCRCVDPEDGSYERVVLHPYAMILYKDAVYCIGKDVGRDTIRALPLDYIHDTQCRAGARFELPDDFEVEQYCHGQFGIGAIRPGVPVTIDFAPEVADHIRTRRVHPTMQLEELPEGAVRLRMNVGQLTEVATWVLGFGAGARVLEPPELVRQVCDELRASLSRYDDGPARTRGAPKRRRSQRGTSPKPAARSRKRPSATAAKSRRRKADGS
jgi:predicted DNA-binding transcriptional regulator YafY